MTICHHYFWSLFWSWEGEGDWSGGRWATTSPWQNPYIIPSDSECIAVPADSMLHMTWWWSPYRFFFFFYSSPSTCNHLAHRKTRNCFLWLLISRFFPSPLLPNSFHVFFIVIVWQQSRDARCKSLQFKAPFFFKFCINLILLLCLSQEWSEFEVIIFFVMVLGWQCWKTFYPSRFLSFE